MQIIQRYCRIVSHLNTPTRRTQLAIGNALIGFFLLPVVIGAFQHGRYGAACAMAGVAMFNLAATLLNLSLAKELRQAKAAA